MPKEHSKNCASNKNVVIDYNGNPKTLPCDCSPSEPEVNCPECQAESGHMLHCSKRKSDEEMIKEFEQPEVKAEGKFEKKMSELRDIAYKLHPEQVSPSPKSWENDVRNLATMSTSEDRDLIIDIIKSLLSSEKAKWEVEKKRAIAICHDERDVYIKEVKEQWKNSLLEKLPKDTTTIKDQNGYGYGFNQALSEIKNLIENS